MSCWLTGEISYQPGCLASGPDAETRDVVPVLAELNRAGFVTDFSQPGIALDEQGDGQRAAVSGACSPALAARLRAAVCRTDLVYLASGGSYRGMVSLVVTIDDGVECTWLGRGDANEYYTGDLAPALLRELGNAEYLEIVDPRWAPQRSAVADLARRAGRSTAYSVMAATGS